MKKILLYILIGFIAFVLVVCGIIKFAEVANKRQDIYICQTKASEIKDLEKWKLEYRNCENF